ncbi:MAG: protein kinase [Acidobacteriota bacterium]
MGFKSLKDRQELLEAATKISPEARTAFINTHCNNDETLRQEIESLLNLHDKATAVIEADTLSDETRLLGTDMQFADEMTGKRIGAYEVTGELGRGGMGAVYLATRADKQYEKQVAIKIVQRGMENKFVINRFRQERQILAHLDHPNIARLIDGGTTEDGLPYFVLEYVEGKPITAYCDDNRLTTIERLQLFRQVCSAIQYAHQNLVVHRDIKPGNILVTVDGVPKLLDFGIAKLLDPEFAFQADATANIARLMTPAYASPEQAKGEPITTSSDIYSLGVLLYQLLTGHRPYEVTSSSPVEMVRVICEQEPSKPSTVINRSVTAVNGNEQTDSHRTSENLSKPRAAQPEKLRRQLAGDLDNIILKALRKEPERRYSSVEKFSDDIRRHLEGLPISARPDTFSYRAGKFIGRHRASVIAATVVTILLLAATATAIWQARIARSERDKSEHRFNQVRKLANAVLFDYHDGIEKLPGSTPMRERMVRDALEYLDNLSQESSNDLTLQRELASAYEKVGLVQGNPFKASFGDYSGALASQRKALTIRERLYAADATNADIRRELAKSYLLIGDLLRVTGQVSEMLTDYLKAQELLKAALTDAPDHIEIRRDLENTYTRLGRYQISSSDMNAAFENLTQALTIAQGLAAEHPQDIEIRRDLALSHMFLGDALGGMGKAPEALDYQRRSLAMMEKLSTDYPDNAQAKRDVGVVLQRLADTLAESGEVKSALEYNRKALAIDEKLYLADPTNAQAQRDLMADYQKIGKMLLALGDASGALEQQRKALGFAEKLAAADPGNAEAQADLSNCYYKLGDVMMAKNDLRGALAYYQNSLAIDEAIAAADPANADARLTAAESHLMVSDLLLKLGSVQEAIRELNQARQTYEDLATHQSADESLQHSLPTVYENLGDAYSLAANKTARAENLRAACDWYQKSLDGWLDLQQRNLLKDAQGKPAEAAQKLAKCKTAVAKLKAQ